MGFSRRELLCRCGRALPGLGGACLFPGGAVSLAAVLASDGAGGGSAGAQALLRAAPRARFWTSVAAAGADCLSCHRPADRIQGKSASHDPRLVQCQLCAHRCAIKSGARGRCRARANVNGELRSLVYGRPAAVYVDPIEKKPFYHFLPGVSAFSLGTTGCPFRCKFCQNWQLSQSSPEDFDVEAVTPAQTVSAASARQAPVIAFTYNEPTVFTEFLLDVAREAKRRGIRPVLVSCGFMNEAPLAEMCDVLDAIKIDLKGFSESFYRTVSDAQLQPVLRSIRQIHRSGVHLELVNLVVPTLNDSDTSLRELVAWVAGELGPDVPVHFTRFHPDYQLLNLAPTPIATLERARAMAAEKRLNYAYVGNVPDHPGNHTYCPNCRAVVIERRGFFVTRTRLANGRCAACGRAIAGVWA